jgi:NitT/TauT family transport system substrate-binding protein
MDSIKIAQWAGRHIAYMPLHIADRLGLFAAQQLDVTIYGAGNDDDIFGAVAKGRAQFGVGDPVFVALGQAHGHDTRVIASIANNVPMWGITHHAEIKPLTQLSDFVGLRVGVFPKPSTAYTMMSALKARHPRLLKSMQIVETEIGQQAYLLASDQVDLILELEPIVSMTQRQGLRTVCSMGDFYPDFLCTGMMTSAAMIEQSPEIVGRVVRALQQALTIIHTNPERAIAVGCELFPSINSNIMTEAVQRMIASHAWPEQAIISPQGWANTLKMRQDVGEIGALPPFETVVDQRFAYDALAIAP